MELKKYDINQSPLYKLNNYKRLLKILDIKDKSLTKLLVAGDNNFYTSEIGGRKVQVPKPQLSRLHKRLQKLFSRIQTRAFLYSGVKGRSNVDNARVHEKSSHLLKVDIAKYYESTSFKRVLKCYINIFKVSPDLAEILARLSTYSGHVPTGSSISQSLTYFCNIKVFDQVMLYCKKRGVTFTLYVDDLTFSSRVPLGNGFLGGINLIFSKNTDYKLHKIRAYNPTTPKKVTGVILKGTSLDVPNDIRKRLNEFKMKHRRVVLNYVNNSTPSSYENAIAHFQKFIGLVSCASQISPYYKLWTDSLCNERRVNNIPAVNQNNPMP